MSGEILAHSDVPVIEADGDFAVLALREAFGLSGRLEALPGEHDRNFKVTAADGTHYLFKIHGARVAPERAELQAAALRHLEHVAPELPVPRLFLGREGAMLPVLRDARGGAWRLRLTTWLDGATWSDVPRRADDAADSFGRLLAQLDRSLAGFDHPSLAEPYVWDLARPRRCEATWRWSPIRAARNRRHRAGAFRSRGRAAAARSAEAGDPRRRQRPERPA